ncbi:hypothetical protein PRUPE_8G041500 [Prunus persica]|uniref:Alliinase C-terminal domain-containing protein n=1 Tax=Prunus persica TaxID=3760 RepID=A0A251MST7_PRUPE|nr:hypothetical protein PRUPE_8G041500 [Prunus persica]
MEALTALSSQLLVQQMLIVTQGRYITFGAGSTQLLNAAVHALSSDNSSSSSSPASVVASIPYYNLHQLQTELFRSTNYVFQGDAFVCRTSQMLLLLLLSLLPLQTILMGS